MNDRRGTFWFPLTHAREGAGADRPQRRTLYHYQIHPFTHRNRR